MKILGVHLDGTKIYLAVLNRKRKIQCFKYNKEDSFIKKYSYIVSGLSSKNILIKKKVVELNRKDLKKSLPFQEASISSFDKKDVIINTIISNRWGKNIELSFYITTKKSLEEHLKKMEDIKIDPDIVTSISQAQMRFFNFCFPHNNEAFLIHIDYLFTHLTLIENSFPKSTYCIKIGKKDLEENSKNLEFFNEVSKFFYSSIEKGKKIPLMITGDITKIEWIEEMFLSKNRNFISRILSSEKKEFFPFAISIGLALEFLEKDNLSIQFRKEEYTSRRSLKNYLCFSLIFLLSSLIFSFIIFFKGENILKIRKNILRKNFFLLKKMENVDSQKLSKKMKISLKEIEEKITKEEKFFLPLPLAPKVSLFLNWMHKNPLFKDVEIVFFDYQIIDFPKNKERNKKYRVKVSLKLKIKDKIIAKKFYEDLFLEKNIIDQNEKISWQEEEELYKISFFLKMLQIKDLYYVD
ncbi:MAG: hypothetical protein AMS24_01805 [Chlamydiae bacterium SM23_39]|nr:MAG: hypothetical protein AMS24_01805 [Chlamydiae bacterium SM23_39]